MRGGRSTRWRAGSCPWSWITEEIVDRARDLLDGDAQLGARDALHAAIVPDRGMEGICSYDRDLDRIDGWRRFKPPAP
jgi:predicted nucleic acid-binding protein